jgi:hypothetical protein
MTVAWLSIAGEDAASSRCVVAPLLLRSQASSLSDEQPKSGELSESGGKALPSASAPRRVYFAWLHFGST